MEKDKEKRKPDKVDGFFGLCGDTFSYIIKNAFTIIKILLIIIFILLTCHLIILQNKNSFYDLSSTYQDHDQPISIKIPPAPDLKKNLVPINTEDLNLPKVFEVKKSKIIHYGQDGLPSYPMKTKSRGIFFMVNIIDFPNKAKERLGAKNDSISLLHLFQEFGFTCFPYHNLTKKQFFEISEKLRKSEYLEKTESFVLTVMSHGGMEDMHDRVQFSDGEMCKVKKIEEFFSETNCKSLIGKPKVMVFPFCRQASQNLTENKTVGCFPTVCKPPPVLSDILVCYGTVRGFPSYRHPIEGSNYIQVFCKILAKHAHYMHLEDMLKLIGKELREQTNSQIIAHYNYGFNNLLFFNPGICEN
ncbi:caspase Dronc-like [Episyrphus balteatus]|uniref:caspase Dronc-like n=1 Tax=Episyrphus balteatus TaxID=286459 RepID=UPI00248630C5|nr:caspase Dronc-like [Episyrphus balteatus]XP_055852398.1 caspase Dronc-like [Episyrphus balteatus]XP_055852399.1 caspase Dronc-like [Episyrphus balteatus]XP_055852400.1 caspase Dronc-like [Episyrphus balteatus]